MAHTDRNRQGSAIRKFLVMCMLFATLIVITLTVCEVLIRREVPNPYRYKHERLSRKSDDVATLVLGSSHAYYGIDPSELGDSAFNLANVSQIYHYDQLLLDHYEFPNLRTVILPVSYFSFTDPEFEDSSDWVFAVNYKIYMDIDEHSDFSRYNFELSRPSIFTKKLRALVERKPLSCDSLGFGLDYSPERRSAAWEETGPETAARHTAADPKALEGNVRYFRKIAEQCGKRGIRILLVTTPAWHTYRDNINAVQYGNMKEEIRRAVRDYGCRYVDLFSDTRFTADDFYDGDHLNSDGARKLARILRDTLAVPPRPELDEPCI